MGEDRAALCGHRVIDAYSGRVLGQLGLPAGWRVGEACLERLSSFERPLQVRASVAGPHGETISFRSGERYLSSGVALKGMNVLAGLYGVASSAQTEERAYAAAAPFADAEAAALARGLGASVALLEARRYPGLDLPSAEQRVRMEANNDAALQGARFASVRVGVTAALRVYRLATPDGRELRTCVMAIVDGYETGVGAASMSEMGERVSSAIGGLVGRFGGGASAWWPRTQQAAAPAAPAAFGTPGAGEVVVWGPRNLATLVCEPVHLEEGIRTMEALVATYRPDAAVGQEEMATKHNLVSSQQQQAVMAQQRQQAQFAAMRQAVNTQRQAIDDYQRAAQARSDAQWTAERARSGVGADSGADWTDRFSDAMRGVTTWVRPDGTEVETSTASDHAWADEHGNVVGGSGGFDPGAGWTELHQK